MKTLISFIAVFSTVFIGNVYADARGPGADNFYDSISQYEEACANECQAPYKTEDAFSVYNPKQSHLSPATHESLTSVAYDQAQVWADTILEGDYIADGKTRLDEVTLLFEGNKFIGYRIAYSERAWFTANCDYSGEDERQLQSCDEGRIHESAYVSPDFRTYFRDEKDLADFSD